MGKTYQDSETECRFTFEKAVSREGSFWHICTPGYLTEIINITADDYKFSVTNMAMSAFGADVVIITDAHMENHLHVLGAGTKEQCLQLLDNYRVREKRYLKSIGREVDLSDFRCDEPILITSLEMMRNEIVYINRNGYVGNPLYTPYSYPWGGGNLYFNPIAQRETGVKFNSLTYREKRKVSRQRVEQMPETYMVRDGMILPSGYVHYNLGEAMFRDAHHYFNMLSRNYEAYSEEAKRLGDSIILSSEELYPAVKVICQRKYNVNQPGLLSPVAKIEVARIMHTEYHATNAQIQRILNLAKQYVDQLFPLGSRK